MDFSKIPTPETDYAIVDTRGYERILPDFARDLERRLTVAREALDGLNKLNLCGRAYEEIETALTLTAPKS